MISNFFILLILLGATVVAQECASSMSRVGDVVTAAVTTIIAEVECSDEADAFEAYVPTFTIEANYGVETLVYSSPPDAVKFAVNAQGTLTFSYSPSAFSIPDGAISGVVISVPNNQLKFLQVVGAGINVNVEAGHTALELIEVSGAGATLNATLSRDVKMQVTGAGASISFHGGMSQLSQLDIVGAGTSMNLNGHLQAGVISSAGSVLRIEGTIEGKLLVNGVGNQVKVSADGACDNVEIGEAAAGSICSGLMENIEEVQRACTGTCQATCNANCLGCSQTCGTVGTSGAFSTAIFGAFASIFFSLIFLR